MLYTLILGLLSINAQATDCTFAEKYAELEQSYQRLVAINAELSDPARNQCSDDTIYSFAEADAILAMRNMIEEEQEKLARALTK